MLCFILYRIFRPCTGVHQNDSKNVLVLWEFFLYFWSHFAQAVIVNCDNEIKERMYEKKRSVITDACFFAQMHFTWEGCVVTQEKSEIVQYMHMNMQIYLSSSAEMVWYLHVAVVCYHTVSHIRWWSFRFLHCVESVCSSKTSEQISYLE
jgi:hypothetical protein